MYCSKFHTYRSTCTKTVRLQSTCLLEKNEVAFKGVGNVKHVIGEEIPPGLVDVAWSAESFIWSGTKKLFEVLGCACDGVLRCNVAHLEVKKDWALGV